MNTKKTCTILASLLGGAIVGSAVTMLVCPKSGAELRRDAHKLILDKLNYLHEQIKEYGCTCGDNCDCDIESGEKDGNN